MIRSTLIRSAQLFDPQIWQVFHKLQYDKVVNLWSDRVFKTSGPSRFDKIRFDQVFKNLPGLVWTKKIIISDKLSSNFCENPWKKISLALPLLAPALLDFTEFEETYKSKNSKNFEISPPSFSFKRKYLCFLYAPRTIYIYNFISFCVYHVLFIYVLTMEFCSKPLPAEITLIIWTFSLIIEEIRQVWVHRNGILVNLLFRISHFGNTTKIFFVVDFLMTVLATMAL